MAFPAGWGRKCELVVQYGKVDANCTDFPVLITEDTLPSEIFDADGSYPALSGGGDIRFSSDSAGSTQLPCEIESFVTDNDPANGKAAVWVKRTLSSSGDTSVWIWYNKSGETQPAEDGTYGKENVWDSNYKMVQHMNQDPSGSSPQMIDSTSNDNDGTSAGTMTSGDLVDGQIGKGIEFDVTDDEINISTSASLDALDEATISVWVKTDDNTKSNQAIVTFYKSDTDRVQLKFALDSIRIYNDIDDIGSGVNSASFVQNDTYYFVTFKVTGTTWTAYVNDEGSAKISNDFGKSFADLANGFYAQIANAVISDQFFGGVMDEIKISNTVRIAGWVTTEYNNQYAPSTFIIEGAPEPGGINPFWYYQMIKRRNS